MQLTLSQCVLRSLRASDAASITAHISSYRVSRNLSVVPHPYTQRHAEQWLASELSREQETSFAITKDDEAVGVIGLEPGGPALSVCCHSAAIGYWLGEAYWGRGIMSEAVEKATEWAFVHLRLIRLHAAVYARNPASARVLEKAGYVFEGRTRAQYFRDGEFIDGLLYAKVRLPECDSPPSIQRASLAESPK